MASSGSDVVVVGGGVIGCAIAFELTQRGVGVTVVDQGRIGGEASWASAGIVSPPSRTETGPERTELIRRGLVRYPSLAAELEDRTGIAVDYRRVGVLSIAADRDEAEAARRRAEWQRSLGFAVEEMAPDEARAKEPALPPSLESAWFAPEGGVVSGHRLALAFASATERAGGTILTDTPVGSVVHAAGTVTGVRLAGGALAAPVVVLAAGAWTRFLGESLGLAVPTKPIKGQALAFANAPVRPACVLAGCGGYVRPRVDGSTVVAATVEDAGFDRRVTGEGTAWLLDLTRRLCPGLLAGELVETWSGLRPGSERGDPYIGPVPGFDGLWVAAGHGRSGVAEAPATAELVATSVLAGRADPRLAPFALPASG